MAIKAKRRPWGPLASMQARGRSLVSMAQGIGERHTQSPAGSTGFDSILDDEHRRRVLARRRLNRRGYYVN